ncbi:MAG: cytochrome c oxidase subunit II [Herpetosiphonaceae bacterium]|nr:cytochrome c oxidase subunit II [Herpetosiphonaceae bacterium]
MALFRVLRRRGWQLIPLIGMSLFLLPALAFAAPKGSGDWLNPFAATAREISQLYGYVYYIAIAVFVLVEALILYASFRYRFKLNREGQTIPQVHGNTNLEITWTAIPAIIVAGLFIMTFNVMTNIQRGPDSGSTTVTAEHAVHDAEQTLAGPAPAGALQVTAIGHRWWWEFRYPELGVTTATMMHVPAGRAIEVTTTSVDVIHAWWVPQMQGSLDAVPGVKTATWFVADANAVGQNNVYHAQCNEYCGTEHALMQFRVVVDTDAEFAAWAAAQAKPATPMNVDLAKRGEAVFAAKACVSCHAISGYPGNQAVGITGPNLTHFYSRPVFAGGAFTQNTPDTIKTWLRNPEAAKPGNIMSTVVKPGYLSDDEIDALTAYLTTLK